MQLQEDKNYYFKLEDKKQFKIIYRNGNLFTRELFGKKDNYYDVTHNEAMDIIKSKGFKIALTDIDTSIENWNVDNAKTKINISDYIGFEAK